MGDVRCTASTRRRIGLVDDGACAEKIGARTMDGMMPAVHSAMALALSRL
jgi:hypothetical protein